MTLEMAVSASANLFSPATSLCSTVCRASSDLLLTSSKPAVSWCIASWKCVSPVSSFDSVATACDFRA